MFCMISSGLAKRLKKLTTQNLPFFAALVNIETNRLICGAVIVKEDTLMLPTKCLDQE